VEIGYYPGCALHGSSNDYEASVRACLGVLEVHLQELDDWICCGATAAHARNLALAERDGLESLLAPCPMCSMELLKTGALLSGDVQLRQEISTIVELDVQGKTRVLNLIQVFQQIGLDAIKSRVCKPLGHIKAACYYGCLLTRPPQIVRFDDSESPRSMETILNTVGAFTVAWNYQTECCGAGLTMANEETVLDLSHKILSNAADHGANCVVVACPMCHVNLDMKQEAMDQRYGVAHRMPVYYLSDLVGLALGLSPDTLGIDRHFVVAPAEGEPCPR
jgi:heterodisulfide reductase subunit B